jgi:hypothetical protein
VEHGSDFVSLLFRSILSIPGFLVCVPICGSAARISE